MKASEFLEDIESSNWTDDCKGYVKRAVEICAFYGDTRLETKYLLLALIEKNLVDIPRDGVVASFGPPQSSVEIEEIELSKVFIKFLANLRNIEISFGLYRGFAVFKATFIYAFYSLISGTHLRYFAEYNIDRDAMYLSMRRTVFKLYLDAESETPSLQIKLLFSYMSEELALIRQDLNILTQAKKQQSENENGF